MIVRLYAATLLLFPPAFRAAFGDCMAADFADGLRDAQRAPGRRHLAGWLATVAWDLVRSISRQWLRTSVPWLTTAYAAAILGVCEGLSSIMLRSRMFWPDISSAPASGWYLAATAAIVFALSVLIFAVWFILPNLRRDAPGSIRA
jgi:hypothetical protein